MNKDVKTKWVAALRSGEFEQGKGHLSVNGKYCCLGVLCELAHREGVVGKTATETAKGLSVDAYGEIYCVGVPPQEVVEWAGMEVDNPILTINGRTAVAAMHNDSFKATFNEIAQGIEDSL